jgi:23S rRNA pseudouridine2457 synthase
MLIALNKPYGILSRFTGDGSAWGTLANFDLPKNVYALGRLDADSEGLLLLSDEAGLSDRLLNPKNRHRREYWAQVENIPTEDALQALRRGVQLSDYTTKPAEAAVLNPQPQMWPRDPPIRYRKSIPDCWVSLVLQEGKNRQVRRMTAAVGHPTLRLVRMAIGRLQLTSLNLNPGQWIALDAQARAAVFAR